MKKFLKRYETDHSFRIRIDMSLAISAGLLLSIGLILITAFTAKP